MSLNKSVQASGYYKYLKEQEDFAQAAMASAKTKFLYFRE